LRQRCNERHGVWTHGDRPRKGGGRSPALLRSYDEGDKSGNECPETNRANENRSMHCVSRARSQPHCTWDCSRKLAGHLRHAAIVSFTRKVTPERRAPGNSVSCPGRRRATASRVTLLPKREERSPRLRSRTLHDPREYYCTVIVPFIPIARCGVQWKG